MLLPHLAKRLSAKIRLTAVGICVRGAILDASRTTANPFDGMRHSINPLQGNTPIIRMAVHTAISLETSDKQGLFAGGEKDLGSYGKLLRAVGLTRRRFGGFHPANSGQQDR